VGVATRRSRERRGTGSGCKPHADRAAEVATCPRAGPLRRAGREITGPRSAYGISRKRARGRRWQGTLGHRRSLAVGWVPALHRAAPGQSQGCSCTTELGTSEADRAQMEAKRTDIPSRGRGGRRLGRPWAVEGGHQPWRVTTAEPQVRGHRPDSAPGRIKNQGEK
jgi:hypothetical protein